MAYFSRRTWSLSKGDRRLSARRKRQFDRRRAQLVFETLEPRHLLATIAWDGGGDRTSWHDAANWAGNIMPGTNDDAVIAAAFAASTINIGAGSREVRQIDSHAPLVLQGATLSTTHIVAPSLSLTGGSVLATFVATTTAVSKLELEISGTLLVEASSKIDVSEKGYLTGRTTGNTTVGGATGRSGGSYGGLGGKVVDGAPNAAYGDYADPDDWGSGGGGTRGGAGGGLVRITAGKMQLDGQLLADGLRSDDGGGGSGGGVYVEVTTLAGSGAIRARGGQGSGETGGGGGRVAVYAQDFNAFNLDAITAPGGLVVTAPGAAGTVHIFQGRPRTHLRSFSPSGQNGGHLGRALDHVILSFNRPIDIGSFDPTDFTIDGPFGPIVPTGMTEAGDRSYRIDFPLQSEIGQYKFILFPTLLDAEGLQLDQDADGVLNELEDVVTFSLTVDTVAPRIAAQVPAGDFAGTIGFVDVWFSETIDKTTFTTADVSIVRPDAMPLSAASIEEVGFNRYRIRFAPQTAEGMYHVNVGPDIADLAGNLLDQDRDGTTGELTDDVYDAAFNIRRSGPEQFDGPAARAVGGRSCHHRLARRQPIRGAARGRLDRRGLSITRRAVEHR